MERAVRKPPLARILSALRCVRDTKTLRAQAVAAHSQFNTLWAALWSWVLRSRVPVVAFSFHFSRLPTGLKLILLRKALARVARFTVHSQPEIQRYASYFGIPAERFDLIRWSVDPKDVAVADAVPLVAGRYLCAMGKDGRDYRTLVLAMEQLPELTLVLVAQPANLKGFNIPSNVKVFCDIPREQAMNILKFSEFMALPLETSETSCGHITIVAAMFAGKPVIITRSTGIADYLPEDYEAPRVEAGDVSGWISAIRELADSPERRTACAINGEDFAAHCCSHQSGCEAALETFRKAGISIA
jgi:glycosyltransferase involved in cell wall biosynthesis